MKETEFAKKRVLITGASSGIGEALARRFVNLGARVALVARRADRLAQLAAELNATVPGSVSTHSVDLTEPAQRDAVVHQVEAALGQIDVLVNNAGLGELGPFSDLDPTATQR